jgi:hypothetical protein
MGQRKNEPAQSSNSSKTKDITGRAMLNGLKTKDITGRNLKGLKNISYYTATPKTAYFRTFIKDE